MARHKSIGTTTIANGASLSSAFSLGDKQLVGLIISAAWTAADLTFQASEDGGTTWLNVFDQAGVELKIATAGVVAGQRVSLDPTPFIGIDMIKIRSGTNAAPVAQGAARTLTVISRKIYPLT